MHAVLYTGCDKNETIYLCFNNVAKVTEVSVYICLPVVAVNHSTYSNIPS